MKNKNVCDKCGDKLTDEELEREVDLCTNCQYKKELEIPDNQQSLL